MESELMDTLVEGDRPGISTWRSSSAPVPASPKGVLNDPALIVVNKEAGQAANTLQWLNIAGMYERLHPACVNNAVWVVNQGVRKALLSLVQPVTNIAGAGVGSWFPVLRDGARGGFEMLGLPVLFTEKVPAFSSQGGRAGSPISRNTPVGLRKEMTLDLSKHLYFDSDETAFPPQSWRRRPRALVAGSPAQSRATLSWCVTLQAR